MISGKSFFISMQSLRYHSNSSGSQFRITVYMIYCFIGLRLGLTQRITSTLAPINSSSLFCARRFPLNSIRTSWNMLSHSLCGTFCSPSGPIIYLPISQSKTKSTTKQALLRAEVDAGLYIRYTICNGFFEELSDICAPNWGKVHQVLCILMSMIIINSQIWPLTLVSVAASRNLSHIFADIVNTFFCPTKYKVAHPDVIIMRDICIAWVDCEAACDPAVKALCAAQASIKLLTRTAEGYPFSWFVGG